MTGVLEISLTYEELVNGEEEERVGPKLSISVHQLTGLTALSESQELNVAVKIAIPGTLYSFRTEAKYLSVFFSFITELVKVIVPLSMKTTRKVRTNVVL